MCGERGSNVPEWMASSLHFEWCMFEELVSWGPNECPHCPSLGSSQKGVLRKGYYWRSSDRRRIPRFHCQRCNRSFSVGTFDPCFRQKKRTLNSSLGSLLCSCVSQRRLALLLGINRKTVVRKFIFLGIQAFQSQLGRLEERSLSGNPVSEVYFDEMESFEHSKCLPLSIPIAVEARTRKILAFQVCSMPSKGPLARISVRKYGHRPDHRSYAARSVLEQVGVLLAPGSQIKTDENPKYPRWIQSSLPRSLLHRSYLGKRGCIVGQQELKKVGFDPLFDLNHTCAMIRANINRLVRKTWCTTKKRERLFLHLALYAEFHNEVLVG